MCAEGNERSTLYKSSVSVRKHSRKNTPELHFTVAVSYSQWLCLLWNCTNCGFALDKHENPPVLPSLVTIYQDSIIALLNPPLAKTQSFLSHSLHQHVVPWQWEWITSICIYSYRWACVSTTHTAQSCKVTYLLVAPAAKRWMGSH